MNRSGSKWQESLYCFCGVIGTLRCDQIKLNLFFLRENRTEPGVQTMSKTQV
jgi:hypothetical protein